MIANIHVTWPLVSLIGLVFVTVCFLAVLWSRREWNTRKIRVGVFLEREYRSEDEEQPPARDPSDEDTKEWPSGI